MNFDKFTIKLHLISCVLVKFLEDQKPIVMSSINCLNYKVL